jgi:hypothetical protein
MRTIFVNFHEHMNVMTFLNRNNKYFHCFCFEYENRNKKRGFKDNYYAHYVPPLNRSYVTCKMLE